MSKIITYNKNDNLIFYIYNYLILMQAYYLILQPQ